ncbi:hypothetical protein ICW40_15920, partial [Actinotalea ferrariae]|nr:hypothetical protein [Actinotalea ferrariae]
MSSPVEATCPTCRAAVAPGSSFCTRCGSVLTGTPAVREIAADVGGGQQWGGRPSRDRRARGGPQAGPGAVASQPAGAVASLPQGAITPVPVGAQVAHAGDAWRAVSA